MLRLPDSMKSVQPRLSCISIRILRTQCHPKQGTISLPPPVEVDGEPEFEISQILDTKVDRCRRNCKLLYLVCWSGYEGTDNETSWLLATELRHASELINNFHLRYPDKAGPHSTQ
jgi:hypothetical protein